MKISCSYCGRIHEKKFDCGKKPIRIKKKYEKDIFRSSYIWQKKTEQIKERDNYLCQFCLRNFKGTKYRINNKRLSVHHAVPLKENYELRLDDENLITTCDMHHEMAESGEITLSEVRKIILIQQSKMPPGKEMYII